MFLLDGLQRGLVTPAGRWPELGNLELFSRTAENQFVFNLFDLLLCGVIVLVILRGWRSQAGRVPARNQLFLFLAFMFLGASFALGAVLAGTFLFFQRHLPEGLFDLSIHAFQGSAWLLVVASAYRRPTGGPPGAEVGGRESSPLVPLFAPLFVSVGSWAANFPLTAVRVLDLADLLLLVWALVLFHRRPLGGRKIATAALAFVFAAALLHLGSCWGQDKESSVILWNFEQFTWSLSLFTFALAIGEASRNLFDKVFVRLQIAFILLASLMILVVVQTEKAEYLASVRGRSEHLLEFARAHVDYFQQQNKPLRAIVEREDFLEQMTLGFGNLAELKIVRIVAGRQAVSFEIAPTGIIRRLFETGVRPASLPSLDPDTYFFIQALPLRGAEPGVVEFYGTREFLNQHIRKRIVLIFSLFTGMVALSTLMIGLVVRGAGVTIRQQAQEIEEAQRRLMQASKMAAIGELASGVAHEINNPATTILSRASFLLSQQGRNSVPSDREDLEAIVSQAQRIAQITGGLLTFSRPHALDIRPVPIVRVIETSLRSLGALFAANHISVEKKLGLDLPRVLVDEDSLARALENIFRNAIDAMPSGGTLHIRTSTEDPAGARLRLEVSDSGIGIQGNHLGRIFDPFFTTKNVGKGAGLGLSIAHGILKEHHGTITVESQPGVGTRFTIILPTEQ